MKNKKGILMAGTVLLFAFLLTYSLWVVTIDKDPANEKLKLGRMVNDIYAVNSKAEEFEYFLKKSGEYALLETLKQRIEGEELIEDCDILYKTLECWFNENKIAKSLAEDYKNEFKDYIEMSGYEINVDDYIFGTELDVKYIIAKGKNDNPVDFGENSERKMSFRKDASFESRIMFNFSEYNEIFDEINKNLKCLKEAEDEQVKEDIAKSKENKKKPEECLGGRFSNVRKINGILYFDYKIDGALIEDGFEGKMAVDIFGFEKSSDIAIG